MPLGDSSKVCLAVLCMSYAAKPLTFTTSAQGFLSFMNGYTVFLGPFAGIMVTDVRYLQYSIQI